MMTAAVSLLSGRGGQLFSIISGGGGGGGCVAPADGFVVDVPCNMEHERPQ